MAEDLGDQDKAKQIQDQLNELEERAEALDRQRTKNISAIRYVAQPLLPGLPLSNNEEVARGQVPSLPLRVHTPVRGHRLLPAFTARFSCPLSLPHSYINQRNREWNIVESEKALVVSKEVSQAPCKDADEMIGNLGHVLPRCPFQS